MERPCERCDRVDVANASSPRREDDMLETCPRPSEMDLSDDELGWRERGKEGGREGEEGGEREGGREGGRGEREGGREGRVQCNAHFHISQNILLL